MTFKDERTRSPWLSDALPPFPSRGFATPDGHRMHDVDVESGPVIVVVHGNPPRSFELRPPHWCMAPRLPGHRRRPYRLWALVALQPDAGPLSSGARKSLLRPDEPSGLKDATPYLSDWGGPVGLPFADGQPERVAGLAIANTWCWPVGSDVPDGLFNPCMHTPLGPLLIKRRNCFVNGITPRAAGVTSARAPEVMDHNRNA